MDTQQLLRTVVLPSFERPATKLLTHYYHSTYVRLAIIARRVDDSVLRSEVPRRLRNDTSLPPTQFEIRNSKFEICKFLET